ncbi:Ribonuclease YqcG [Bacillus licheniformis]|uniref:ribonuclease YeeF family protein n=1 Tax=Bacillus haynesii TaxID=1925021 RepID=UPI0012B92791|nr:LXG domain-containing protein [Bacillus haynesii]TWK27458.1 Ribonuclease YqcG [Bacillus licheniformis]MCY7838209.1 LXG domain-containing protein [Bacillus haynesii]MCY7991744.1 LXG domain-containing protein [Bacillus haynesii]MCY8094320.1 LXG domain-containing protein [Bacillus haynesii]MCY8294882.1 LXG domain-containing protein [Bacillus haynesii]
MKVYEAETLISAMKQRSDEYKNLREQLVSLKKALNSVAELDEFQGKGADAIKAFYRDQSGVVDGWLDLADMQIQFLNGVSAAAENAGLSEDTFVDVQFLEQELANVHIHSQNMVSAQQQELSNILGQIDDLISLQPFSSDEIKQQLDAANQNRKDTIKAVEDLDGLLKREYSASEQIQQMIQTDYSALIDATGKGKNASPLNYNSHIYQNSEVYKLKHRMHQEARSYIANKQKQYETGKAEKADEH